MRKRRWELLEWRVTRRDDLDEEKRALLQELSLEMEKFYDIARNHLLDGERIRLGSPPDFRIIYLLTNHCIYGTGARSYINYGTVTSEDGQECLFFQTLASRGGKGTRGRMEWFLELFSYKIQQSPYDQRNTFVTWTQAIMVVPKGKGYIQGISSKGRLSPAEVVNLKRAVAHPPRSHPKLVKFFACLHHSAAKFESREQRQAFYIEAEAILNDYESCRDVGCRLRKNLKDRFQRAKSNENYYFPIGPGHKPKHDDRKLHPPVDVCKYLTGTVLPYSPPVPRLH
jgi:hypothetical protein